MKKKFRAWDESVRCYTNNFFVSIDGDVMFYDPVLGMCSDDGLVLEQWTGLKDKNGKNIYEGDIVRLNYSDSLIAEVCYQENDDCNGIGFILKRGCMTYHFSSKSNREVIGNIHEEFMEAEG